MAILSLGKSKTKEIMNFIISLVLSTLAVMTAAYITPGAEIDSWLTALVVAVMLGLMNAVVKPILVVLTLPINIMTLGLFMIVINLGLLALVEFMIAGFSLGGLLPLVIFAILLSILNGFLGGLADK